MKVLVTGGRAYPNKVAVYKALDALYDGHPVGLVICGGAGRRLRDGSLIGADRLAMQWAEDRIKPCMVFPPPWESLGKKAGPVRNEWMFAHGCPDRVIAFPGGAGTGGTKLIAERLKIPVVEIEDTVSRLGPTGGDNLPRSIIMCPKCSPLWQTYYCEGDEEHGQCECCGATGDFRRWRR